MDARWMIHSFWWMYVWMIENLSKIYRTSMGMHGNPWESMEIHENAWKSIGMHGNLWECIGDPWESMENLSNIYGNAWTSMGIHGNPRKSMENFNRRSKWLKIVKNDVLRFLPFYPLISAFQASPRIPIDWSWRDLSIAIKNSSFHALWLGIGESIENLSKI